MIRSSSALLLAMFASFGLSASEATGTVTVIHGIPGVTVDVYVDGTLALKDFAPGTVTDPIELPAGEHDLALTAPGGSPDSPILTGKATLQEGANASIVAHLGSGGPAITVFANDVSDPGQGKGRLVVRHAAAAPEVDVAVRFAIWRLYEFEGLTTGQEDSLSFWAGRYSAAVYLAGTDTKVLGPAPVHIHPRSSVIVYAIGSAADGTLDLLTQEIDLTAVKPAVAKVTVVHGVPGLTVDVFVNGNVVIPNFAPETITDPIELPPGDYDLAIAPAGAGIGSAVLTGSATLAAGDKVSIVAHLGADKAPRLSFFSDAASPVPPPKAALVVRHVAAAPTVDIKVKRSWGRPRLIEGLSSGEEGRATLAGRHVIVSILPAGGDEPVAPPAKLFLRPMTITTLYAIGSLEDGTFKVLAKTSFGGRKLGD